MSVPAFCIAPLLLAIACGHALGGDLRGAYEAALRNDATYQAARAELASSLQNLPIARAGLLPTLSLSISDNKIEGSRTIDNPPNPTLNQPLDYRAPTQSLSLRAPLFNREASKKVALAQAQEHHALALLRVRQTELADRLAKAFLDALLANYGLNAAQVQVQIASIQGEVARRRLAFGEGTRIDVADAASALSAAQIQVYEARAQRELAMLTFSQITGQNLRLSTAPGLPIGPSDLPLRIVSIGELLAQAEVGNASLVVRRFAVQVAQIAVDRARSGHFPRLDLVASLTQSSNDSLSTVNQSATQRSFGLQLNVPLYSGGAVTAGVTQALADQARAQSELEAEQHATNRELTRLYSLVANGQSKLAALQTAVESAKISLEGAQKSLNLGFITQLEVSQARRKLTQANHEWAQGMQEFLLAGLRLSLRVGDDPADAMDQLDAALTASSFVTPADSRQP